MTKGEKTQKINLGGFGHGNGEKWAVWPVL